MVEPAGARGGAGRSRDILDNRSDAAEQPSGRSSVGSDATADQPSGRSSVESDATAGL